jgi:hypothetical protein
VKSFAGKRLKRGGKKVGKSLGNLGKREMWGLQMRPGVMSVPLEALSKSALYVSWKILEEKWKRTRFWRDSKVTAAVVSGGGGGGGGAYNFLSLLAISGLL